MFLTKQQYKVQNLLNLLSSYQGICTVVRWVTVALSQEKNMHVCKASKRRRDWIKCIESFESKQHLNSFWCRKKWTVVQRGSFNYNALVNRHRLSHIRLSLEGRGPHPIHNIPTWPWQGENKECLLLHKNGTKLFYLELSERCKNW